MQKLVCLLVSDSKIYLPPLKFYIPEYLKFQVPLTSINSVHKLVRINGFHHVMLGLEEEDFGWVHTEVANKHIVKTAPQIKLIKLFWATILQ